MNRIAANLKRDISESRKTSKPVVFLGGDCSDNSWREEVRKEFGDRFFFLDPYEEDWDPEEDIYNELAGMTIADQVLFYKGGEGTDKEKDFLKAIGADEFTAFDTVDSLKKYLNDISTNRAAVQAAMEKYDRPMPTVHLDRPTPITFRKHEIFRSGPKTHQPEKGVYRRLSPQEKKKLLEERE